MGFLKRLSERAADEYVRTRDAAISEIADRIYRNGYVLNTDKSQEVGRLKFKVHTHVSAGMWLCRLPEFLAYGPLEFGDPMIVAQVLDVYLQIGDEPQDGDEVILPSRRVLLRKMSPEITANEFGISVEILRQNPAWIDFMGPPRGFQIVGNLEPPVALYEGTPSERRTLTAEEDYDVMKSLARARARRDSREVA